MIKYLIYILAIWGTEVLALHTEYDKNGTRYQLVRSSSDDFNWLFFPGGPGADSSYFIPLIKKLILNGNIWLVDLPQNGSNAKEYDSSYSFDNWFEYFLQSVKRFKNPVCVGHSFGGKLPLMFSELEDILKGLVIIASCPSFNPEESNKLVKSRGLNISKEASSAFRNNHNTENFTEALLAFAPMHFSLDYLEEGKSLFSNLPFNFYAPIWESKNTQKIYDRITWVPQNVPTLIVGGDLDCINPVSLYLNDLRFKRENIDLRVVCGAGHFPWIEKMGEVSKCINNFAQKFFVSK